MGDVSAEVENIRQSLETIEGLLGRSGNVTSESKPESVVGKLRDEIVESQKARTEFTKWKLILIAGIGGAALGLGEKTSPGIPILFGLLPLACLYVDVVCSHNDIRVMVIARFLRARSSGDVVEYENHCKNFRSIFRLESFALTGTTVLISAMVAAIGFTADVTKSLPTFGLPSSRTPDLLVILSSAVLSASGMLFRWKTVRLRYLANLDVRNPGLDANGVIIGVIAMAGVVTIALGTCATSKDASSDTCVRGTALVAAGLILCFSLFPVSKDERACNAPQSPPGPQV